MLFLRAPGIQEAPEQLRGLPDPGPVVERLRGTDFARELERIADGILQGRFELLGYQIETGPDIDWRRDYVHGVSSGTAYFRLIHYLDFEQVGDHKVIWELNRHQHLVLLAQVFRLTGRREYLNGIVAHLEGWFEANPYGRGINWASALEVAFRALSWIWTYHLAGGCLEPEVRRKWLAELNRHGCYLENNLSVYFSPNTHLLGEALALYALGVLFPKLPRARKWERLGREFTLRQLERQVREDGSHFEQSSYYHVYALDMFLFYYLLAGRPAECEPRLERMAAYLEALMGPKRTLPLLGDDDGGRFFHPYGERARFGRASLATCAVLWERSGGSWGEEDLNQQAAWWLGEGAFRGARVAGDAPGGSRLFPQAGIAVMHCGPAHIITDAGPFGCGSAGHSHSDTLSVVVRYGDEEILTDSGTFTYLGDRRRRDWFRGSSAHNTVRVDARDQATAVKVFGWSGRPRAEIAEWSSRSERDFLDASCRYENVRLRRRVLFLKPDLLIILDEIVGPPGDHLVEQFWHLGGQGAHQRLSTSGRGEIEEGGEHGWRSTVYGRMAAAPVLRVAERGPLPAFLAAAVDLAAVPSSGRIEVTRKGSDCLVRTYGRRSMTVEFPETGLPRIKSGSHAESRPH